MQERHRISLNAIRVFAIVARTGSLTAAGSELGVTSGAVSHQLKKLEDELGVIFFRRGNNTVSLTEIGRRFYQEVAPAIGLIERSAEALYRDENEIGVHATTSLALRWLIPSLDRFRALCPQVRVRVETSSARGFPAVPDSDVSIRHFRIGEVAEGWEFLARDLRRPVVSPGLLAKDANHREIAVSRLPALQCCVGNWDWQLWCEAFRLSPADLSFGHAFDTDDAALHACVAGLGVLLTPTILTGREMKSGALINLPGYEPVETGTYRYRRRSESRAVRQFCSWMDAEMRNLV
ncbi:LysR substrate-binding domain-containing protein [Rhizobium sp. CNPSo 4039]|uniref:LysR substrate-binding domain-containing protein n=1 Tax=Rhizobium sp. CNPSo 4039 TaxID=3021409 RepID=UPI0025506703|nr:LysR substrate-binding domain-containing protein [Rhizobium sp. CNPSo 4039]MDK4715001.1 LysR substrate-binding domain-containing protein [Rhizobium sp. CNPSo 4039]